MTALKRVAPKFLTANGWLTHPVMTRTNSENYQLLSTEKHLLFYCKWHFNWHIGVLGFHHLNSCALGARRQTQRLPDYLQEGAELNRHWAMQKTSFYVTTKKLIITTPKQTESQPSPKPKCPAFTFKHEKRPCYITCLTSEKAKCCHFPMYHPEMPIPLIFWVKFSGLVQMGK